MGRPPSILPFFALLGGALSSEVFDLPSTSCSTTAPHYVRFAFFRLRPNVYLMVKEPSSVTQPLMQHAAVKQQSCSIPVLTDTKFSTYLWYQHYSQIVLCFSFVNSVKELAEIK